MRSRAATARPSDALRERGSRAGARRRARRGEAYLVGAGPGGTDLITIRGRQLLASADVVLYDRLVSAELLSYARRDAELICVGKTPRRPSITQKQLNRLLVQLVQSGKRVCRFKGGDPIDLRPRRRGARGARRGGAQVPSRARRVGSRRLRGVRRHAADAARRARKPCCSRRATRRRRTAAVAAAQFSSGADARAVHGRRAVRRDRRRADRAAATTSDTPVAVVESGTTDRQRVDPHRARQPRPRASRARDLGRPRS